MFLNLLSNAVKYTDRDGKVLVITELLNKNEIRVSVTDTGRGIKIKDQDKIFKLFGSISNEDEEISTKGIGFGLMVSKLIVEEFNGKIDFVSKWKIGSTFFYTF